MRRCHRGFEPIVFGLAVWLASPTIGCGGHERAPAAEEIAQLLRLPDGFPLPSVPADNPLTREKIELGRHLFYDPALSANGMQSCASCHVQARAFTDGRETALGSTGQVHPRNSQSLTNVAYNATLTWANPLLVSIEQQVMVPLFGELPIELGVTGHEDLVLDRLRDSPMYRELFAAANPDAEAPIAWPSIIRALASFCRALISGRSPFDRFVYGHDAQAISDSAKRGLDLFFSERLECHHCHGGFNFTLSSTHDGVVADAAAFHNTGLYNVDERGGYPDDNTGVHAVTHRSEDMGRFRAPTLRNIAVTAPYMHDGSVASLEDVVRIYEAGGRLLSGGPHAGDGRTNPHKSGLVTGFRLTDGERRDLLAFLATLTDQTFLSDPELASPFEE
ncbi:MAG: di-heme enzyme [Deltaproteobacteria bacterium]|nr:di-heme enzyme [Deltaproteobacteria bacterium]